MHHPDFFSALFFGGGFIELRALPSKARCFVPADGPDGEAIEKFLNAHRGENVYFGVAARREATDGTLENCASLAALFTDLDFKTLQEVKARERLATFPLPPSFVVSSGGGLHAYWLLHEPLDLQAEAGRAKDLLRRLAHEVGGDLSAAEPARVLRVPGTLNRKYTPPRQVTVELLDRQRQYSPGEFDQVLPQELANNGQGAPFTIPAQIHEGTRNGALYRLARSLKAKGLSPTAILAALEAENAARCEPPLLTEEVREITTNAVSQADRPEFASMSGETEHLTDFGNARRLVRQHGQDFRYCPTLGWIVWDGRRWAKDETGEAMRRAKEAARSLYAEAAATAEGEWRKALAAHARRSEAEPRLRAMISLAESEPGVPVLPSRLDVDPYALNVLNGTLALQTGELRPHRREDLLTRLISIAYDPRARSPVWDACIGRILPEPALRRFVQKAVGYSLTGDTREQVMFFVYGTGANGKTTFLTTVTTLLADYARWTPTDTLLIKRGDAIPNDVARLHGTRLVAAVESESGRRLAESLVKQLTGGDPIAARFLHREFFEFRPTFKVWLGVNHKPEIRGTDAAIWRRVRLIPFMTTIPEEDQDKTLIEKLKAELPGILRWAVEGCLLWQREGLGMPEAVKNATESYRAEMDTFGSFLEERCAVVPEARVTSRNLYDAYVAWCMKTGERTMSRKMLGLRLEERGFRQDRTKTTRLWCGLSLQEGEDEPEPAWVRTPAAREEYEL